MIFGDLCGTVDLDGRGQSHLNADLSKGLYADLNAWLVA